MKVGSGSARFAFQLLPELASALKTLPTNIHLKHKLICELICHSMSPFCR